jgi:dTDP-glucose 4,6-dehydratase
MTSILVTGGAGFIGSNFVRLLLGKGKDVRVTVLDKLTYAGNLLTLRDVLTDKRFQMIKGDIADPATVKKAFQASAPDFVVNFAAESHVDRSIEGPRVFVKTNVSGAFELLEESRRYWSALPKKKSGRFRFLQISTDEVYGSLGPKGLFEEETPYQPNSPYSATKAAADHLGRAYFETYGLPVLLTNCSNNYGPYQYPEKLIPLTLLNALEGKALPIYGDGLNVRDWLYVGDHCEALWTVLTKGKPGEKYNVGGNSEKTNLQVVDTICQCLEEVMPPPENPSLKLKAIRHYTELKVFVKDRPGHDRRYAIDASKIKRQLGWEPRHDFTEGIRETVRWYLLNRIWCAKVQTGKYNRQRLGLAGGKK